MSEKYYELREERGKGEIPVHSVLTEHAWILPRAMFPVLVQQASYYVWPSKLLNERIRLPLLN